MDYKTGVSSKTGVNSDIGTAAEVRFCFEAFNRGLCPCVPWGSPACFDLIVLHKKTGKPIIIQVKTGSSKVHGSSFRYQVKATCMDDRVHLRETNVEFLVVHEADHAAWYIVPVKKITATQIRVYPHKRNSRGSYEKFRDCWNYFGVSSGDQVLLN